MTGYLAQGENEANGGWGARAKELTGRAMPSAANWRIRTGEGEISCGTFIIVFRLACVGLHWFSLSDAHGLKESERIKDDLQMLQNEKDELLQDILILREKKFEIELESNELHGTYNHYVWWADISTTKPYRCRSLLYWFDLRDFRLLVGELSRMKKCIESLRIECEEAEERAEMVRALS